MNHFKIPKFTRSPFLGPISRDTPSHTHVASSHQCWPSLLSVADEKYMLTRHNMVQPSCTYCTYLINSFVVNLGVVYSATAQPHTSQHDNSGLLQNTTHPLYWTSSRSLSVTLEVRGQWTPVSPERLTWSTNLVAAIPKDPEEITDLARHTEGWGVTTELTLTPSAYPNRYRSIAPDRNSCN